MLEPIQILLAAVVVILTVLLVIIGVQVFLILGEFRKALVKMNETLDDVKSTVNGTGRSIKEAVEKITSLSGLTNFLTWIVDLRRRNHERK